VNEMPIASIGPGPRAGNLLAGPAVTIVPFLAVRLIDKQEFEQRGGGEVLLVGNGFGDERPPIKLFAARFQFVPILVPRAPAAPILLTIQQRDDCSRPGQHDKSAANDAPTEQPPKKAHEGAALPDRRLRLVS